MITIEEYIYTNTTDAIKNLTSYCGIKKCENPKWKGWAELQRLKHAGCEYRSDYLDVLVYNFYCVKYIASKLYE